MKWKEDRQSININLRGRLKQLSPSAEEFVFHTDICFGNGLLGSKLLKDRSQESSLVQIFVPPTIPGCISHAHIRSSGPAHCHSLLISLTLSMHRLLTLTRIRLTSLPARPCRASHDPGRPSWPYHDLILTRP